MNATPTDWLPGLLMLGAGAIAALSYLLASRRTDAPAVSADATDDLTARYHAKLAELREHHANRHLVLPTDWDATRERLERAAAAILRERDGAAHERAKAAARAEQRATAQAKDTSFRARNPTLTGALLGAAVVGFFALLGYTLSSSTTERKEGMSATGRGGRTDEGPQEAPAEDAELTALSGRVQAHPDDAEAVGDLAIALVRRQAFDDVRPVVEHVTQLDPYLVKGRVARTILRAVDGETKPAQDELERLGAAYPEAYDARLFAGLLALEAREPARALRDLQAYARTAPAGEQPPMLQQLLRQLETTPSAAP